MAQIRVGVDHNDDGWINWVGDVFAPNLVPFALWEKTFDVTNTTLTAIKELSQQGIFKYTAVMGADAANIRFKTAHQVAVTLTNTYTGIVWIKANTAGTFTLSLVDQNNVATGNATISVGTGWKAFSVSVAATGDDTHFRIRISKDVGTAANTIQVKGFGIYLGALTEKFFNSGNIASTSEDLTPYVLAVETQSGFSADMTKMVPEDGTARIILNNQTRTFSPRNTASPYYGLLDTMLLLRVEVSRAPGEWEPLWTGYIDTVEVTPGKNGDRQAIISGLQGLMQMDKSEIFIDPEEKVRADALLKPILETSKLPSDRYTFTFNKSIVGVNTYLYEPDEILDLHGGSYRYPITGSGWKEKITVRRAMHDIVVNEQGFAFVDREGRFCFRNRNELFQQLDTFKTLSDNDFQEGEYRKRALQTSHVEVQFKPRELYEGVLWASKSEDPIVLEPEKSYVNRVEPKTPEGFDIFVMEAEPFSAPHHSLSWFTAENDSNGHTTRFRTLAKVQASPGRLVVIFRNLATNVTSRIAGRVWGSGFYTKDEVTIRKQNDAAFTANRGREQVERIDLNLVPDNDEAEAVADAVLNRMSVLTDALETARFRIGRNDKGRVGDILDMRVGSTVMVTEYQSDMDTVPHIVRGERYSWSAGRWDIELNFLPLDTAEYGIFDQSVVGDNTTLRY